MTTNLANVQRQTCRSGDRSVTLPQRASSGCGWFRAALVSAALASAAGQPAASPLYLTVEVVDSLGTNYVPVGALPSKQYTFMVDLGRQATYRQADGSVVTIDDAAPYDWFYTEELQGNYVRSGLLDSTSNNVGNWLADGVLRQNVWGSGPTSGTFTYATRMSLNVHGINDRVQVDAMWAQRFDLTGADSILTPGAMWTVFDEGRALDGSDYWGSYLARLAAVSTVDPTIHHVSTPGTLWLAMLALVAVLSTRPFRLRRSA